MPLNNQLETPDNRLMTPKIKSLKNRLTPRSAKKHFDKSSVVPGTEFDHYEHLAMKPLDDQRCYAALNNLLTTPDNRLMTPKIKSIKNQLAPPSSKKQLNFSCSSKSHGSDNYEHLAMRTLGDQAIYATLNNLLTPARAQSINDPFMTSMLQSFNNHLTTPNLSVFSGSYCEILTPITDSELNCTIGSKDHSSPIEYGLFPRPSRPIRGRHNKRGKITYIPSSVERKPKSGLFARAKKETSARTLLTEIKQVEEVQKSDQKKSSQVVPLFKRGKLRSSLSKLKHRITRKNQSIKGTSPHTSPLKKPQHHEDLYPSNDKSPSGKEFLSKCRNRLQNLALF